MRSLVLAGVVVGLSATFVLSDEGIPPETLARIKGATAYVKVVAGDMAGSGSGFVIKVDGDSAYVVTNHHVVEPTVAVVQGIGPGFGPRFRGPRFGGPRFGLTPRILVQTLKNTKATVVLYSGTPKEDAHNAEVLAADPDLDLAVLKVSGFKELPQPVDIDHPPG